MPYSNDPSVGDFEKLKITLRELSNMFGSVEGVLRAFGLMDMPLAQRTASEARRQRSLLLEQLLEGRERMLQRYPNPPLSDQPTVLTKMLLNEAPDSPLELDVGENSDPNKTTNARVTNKPRYMPPMYEQNYTEAYRRCLDHPGGTYFYS